ncbi:hypothetical protein F994_02026 [Acinetobacter bohemicus ANC 3994]|uniref:Phage abortive infection protein n=1 Tax=Acinetobacter bohemicus ANC 3994 TaxID=1217715 RepID=N8NYD7_9GAMM|nr:putative phage abortive infection protein [Acinetobacter bohemicus]ENU19170.1 hypothetical protein F994_02026 [Acinetobacter bohemicus ANC 3994]
MTSQINNTPNPDKEEKDEINRLEMLMTISTNIAAFFFLLIFSLYFINFGLGSFDFSQNKSEWGAFGDFIGGILNPTIAAFALFWLITSVNLQIKELRKTNEALAKTVETAEKQQNQTSIQNFESLFFQLLKTKNDSLDDIEYKRQDNNEQGQPINIIELKSVDAIKQHIIDFKNDPRGDWLKYYEEKMLDYTGSYFRICYQIVKLIDNNETLVASIPKEKDKSIIYSAEQKKYFDIFRATLTKHEIEAFFFNCLNQYGNKKFKKLIEKYGLFEPLPIDNDRKSERNHRLTRYAYQYESIVFEENSYWKNYFSEISKIDITISLEDLESTFEKLISTSIINQSIIHGLNIGHFEETSGFCYQFNGHINSKDIYNIFSEENLNKIKNSPTFINPKSEISNKQENIKSIDLLIQECITWFNKNGIKNYDEKIAEIGYPSDRQSIKKLNQIKETRRTEINNYKNIIIILDQKLISIQESDATLTAFILIKYGISYTEYSEYIKSKQSLNTLVQQN